MTHNAGLWLANGDHVTQCWPLIGCYQHDKACQSSQPKPSILSSFLSQNVSFRLYCGNSSLFVSPPHNSHITALLSLSIVVQKLRKGMLNSKRIEVWLTITQWMKPLTFVQQIIRFCPEQHHLLIISIVPQLMTIC